MHLLYYKEITPLLNLELIDPQAVTLMLVQTQQSNVKPIQATRWIESVKWVQKTKRDVSGAHNNIEQSIKTFDDNSDGTLIVINYINHDDIVQANKKSDIGKVRNHGIYDDRGFSIALDDNGNNNEEESGKKDEVYSDIQSTYKDMEKRVYRVHEPSK